MRATVSGLTSKLFLSKGSMTPIGQGTQVRQSSLSDERNEKRLYDHHCGRL